MKVSIIIPAYNVEGYIKKAISSIISQNFKELEVIVVNDGSTDNTLEQVNSLIEVDSRVKIFNIENGGVSKARNFGIDKANGEYLMFLDADDWLEDGCIEKLYLKATNKDLDILIFNYYTVYKGKRKEYKIINKDEIISKEEGMRQIFLGELTPSICDKFIKKDLFGKELRFNSDIAVGEDLLLLTELTNNAKKIGKLNRYYYYYLMRESSVTHTVTEKIFTIKKAIDKIEKYLKSNELFEEYLEEFEYLSYMHLYFYRVIVGNMCDSMHREFYENYKTMKNIHRNKYFKTFIGSAKGNVKFRIMIYEINYKIARFIHKLLLRGVNIRRNNGEKN